ncbi:succinate semialdehyde dehydrogenase NADP+ linked, partial [Rhizophlyctis rosea]
MRKDDTRLAIDAAAGAFEKWRGQTARTRATVLRKWYDLMIANADDLARIMTLECGKPLAESQGEVTYGASFIQWFSEEAPRLYGDTIPPFSPSQRTLVLKQPIGVCALITPWNFPIAMITRKAGAALAAGCTAVIKPASETPLSALAIARLGEEAGIPEGVLNVVTTESGRGTKEVGEELCTNETVRKISFTGSTAVGKLLMKQASGTIKKVSLELGGNAPFIVFEDADIDAAVEGCIQSKFRNTGQTCVCVNRIYVHSSIYSTFAERLAARVKSFKVGHGLDEGVTIGPLISDSGLEKVRRHVEDAKEGGAE